MRVDVNSCDLLEVLEKLTPVLDKSSKDLASATVLLHSDSFSEPTGLAVIAANSHTRVKLEIQGEVADEGEVCLAPEALSKLLKAVTRPYLDNQITFSLNKTTNQVSVAVPNLYRASIQGVPTDNFPKLVTSDSYYNQIALDSETFLSALNLLTKLEQTREGVWLSCRNGQVEMSGGDGQVVLSDFALWEGEEVDFVGLGLSTEVVNLLISLLPDDSVALNICTDANTQHIYFDTNTLRGEQIFLSTRLL